MPEKKDFLEKQKALLKEWTEQIDDLKLKAKKVQVDASVKFDNYIDDLRVKLEDAKNKLESIQEAGDSKWEELRSGVDKAWEEIKEVVDKAKSKFS